MLSSREKRKKVELWKHRGGHNSSDIRTRSKYSLAASLFVFCLDMPSLAPPSTMSKQKEAMENKATGNFIILYKSAKPTEASLCLCGLQTELRTSPLKWTLLIKYCCASLPMSCQSPHYAEKISTAAELRSFFSRNASLYMFLFVLVCMYPASQRQQH